MSKLLGFAAALVMAVGLAGCASGPGGGSPCEKCENGYYATGKSVKEDAQTETYLVSRLLQVIKTCTTKFLSFERSLESDE